LKKTTAISLISKIFLEKTGACGFAGGSTQGKEQGAQRVGFST